ncbi:voltage-gated potassium channel [Methanocalculus alkaliphilus]|uniref:ion transporter n=1 Tax=Methanocalculus alkaliphilus TaxID=768730 RepID=UPI00209E6EA9|nr:ion transporter [Methanocalculus alkaliphilus]MCP1714492.1 voltage-gated potassium channel [Methanocalculus alkaliphilus]
MVRSLNYSSIRKRVYDIMEPVSRGTEGSYLFGLFITIAILANLLAMILLSVSQLQEISLPFYNALWSITGITLMIFIYEYIIRIWASAADPIYRKPLLGRLKWAMTPYALIDLIVILPFILLLLFGINLTGLVVLRIFRLFKLLRYSESINLIIRVIKSEKDTLITTYLVLGIALFIAGTLMYEIEKMAQPEAFASIPAAMWWGVITLTTVGYGDVVPITPLGKMLGTIIALIGIGIFALPAGILASGFTEAMKRETRTGVEDETYLCPHCKEEIMKNELWRK